VGEAMWGLFRRKVRKEEQEGASIWKEDFSDCTSADFLPEYSVCLNKDNINCRYVAKFADMTLCGHPEHKAFIPEGSEPFDPHKGQFD
jgi:hypothetical protein